MERHSELLTKIWESVFNTPINDTPVHTTMRPFHERPTPNPPPHTKTERPARESVLAFSLEKFFWVVLSGFGVLVLMAIFMKLGGPIRRVRRQLSNVRPALINDEIAVTLRPDVGNLDMASLLRLSDDLPPPYSECVRSSTNKHDIEEPPPPFSACFVSFTNPIDAEPQVHMRRQNDVIENGQGVESVPMNNSESVAPSKRTELIFEFDNGRIVERLS